MKRTSTAWVPGACALVIALLLGFQANSLAQSGNPRLQGIQLYKAGKYAEAIPYFDKVLDWHSRDVEIYNLRGICHLKLNQPRQALADFDQIVRHEFRFVGGFGRPWPIDTQSTWLPRPRFPSWYPEGWGNRGLALLMLGKDEEAAASFREAIDRWPFAYTGGTPGNLLLRYYPLAVRRGMAGAYEGLGRAYLHQGKIEEAIGALNQAVALAPNDANALAGRGDMWLAVNRFQDAIVDYDQALKLDPQHGRAYAGRGIARAFLGRDNEALDDLNQALRLDPTNSRAYSHRGALWAQLGHNQEALTDYREILKQNPKNAWAFKDLGGVLSRLGRQNEALEALNQAIKLDPSSSKAYQNRGAAYNELGQYERAIQDLNRAIELDPNNVGAHSNLGLAYFGAGQYDASLAELDKAISIGPHVAIPYFNRAEILARLGERARAAADYERAIELEPRLTAAHAALAHVRSLQGDARSARSEYDRAVELDPSSPELFRMRADLRRQAGDWKGALADYDQAIQLDPTFALTYVSRAWVRLGLGVAGADLDARVYLKIKGYEDSLAPGMALVAVLGAKAAGRINDSNTALEEALANVRRSTWPAPVLRYLNRESNVDEMLKQSGEGHMAEAHAFLGLDLLAAKKQKEAITHLRQALDAGSRSLASDIANATLERLGESPR